MFFYSYLSLNIIIINRYTQQSGIGHKTQFESTNTCTVYTPECLQNVGGTLPLKRIKEYVPVIISYCYHSTGNKYIASLINSHCWLAMHQQIWKVTITEVSRLVNKLNCSIYKVHIEPYYIIICYIIIGLIQHYIGGAL